MTEITPEQTQQKSASAPEDRTQQHPSKAAKRKAQHEHWMRVMMEGQSTPDLRYQKDKI